MSVDRSSANKFQADVLAGASAVLQARRIDIKILQQPDIGYLLNFGRFELWVYEDGANLLGPNKDVRYETSDYADLDLMRKAIVGELLKTLSFDDLV